MVRFFVDEDFDFDVIRGVLRADPTVTCVTVHQAGLRGANDEAVLDFANERGLVVLTRDVATMVGLAYRRIEIGQPMSGLLVQTHGTGLRDTIDSLLLIATCGLPEDFQNRVIYLPLR